MTDFNLLHIALAYLVIINVVTFFMYGIDKLKAKKNRWRIPEATLLGMAVICGSIGAWLGMKVWHHKTMHKKFKYGVPFIILVQIAVLVAFTLNSCSSAKNVNAAHTLNANVADKVWDYAKQRPDGFTLHLPTMTEPKTGIAVSYAETQGSHSRAALRRVVAHAESHDGYVGGWYNAADGLYYFDSTRLFPEDSLDRAIRFGKENGQKAVYILSSKEEIPIDADMEHSPTVFIVMYDKETGKDALLKAVKEYCCEVIYDYNIIPGMALKKPDGKSLEETMQYFRKVKGVLSVYYDRVYHLDDPVKPKLEVR